KTPEKFTTADMAASSRIVELSATIHETTIKVDAYLAANDLPTPSFDISCPPKLFLPPEIQACRDAVLEATDELTALMLGPVESLIPPPNSWISVTALERFKIANSFPPGETSTFAKIAKSCSISESDCRRLMRHAMTFYIFSEPTPDVVAHTASSKALAEIPPVGSFIGFVAEEMLPASTRLVDAMQKWPGSEESNETGFALLYDTDVPMMQVASADPRRAQQMGNAMSFLHSRPGENVRYLVENFPWSGSGLLVDIGGAKGTVGIEIARHVPGINIIVQDKPEVIRNTEVPEDLGGRLQLMGHDFFTTQPVKDADIYLIRNVLHDWSNKYAAKILSNLIPALKKGARVLINDRCLPPPGALSLYKARQPRASDLYMKGIQNAKERDSADWAQLFESVDPRFSSLEVISPPGSFLSMIKCYMGRLRFSLRRTALGTDLVMTAECRPLTGRACEFTILI
ncbi:O-methyltransferase gsfB, partial [Lachnellula suecica]